jgi:hypothetical protein
VARAGNGGPTSAATPGAYRRRSPRPSGIDCRGRATVGAKRQNQFQYLNRAHKSNRLNVESVLRGPHSFSLRVKARLVDLGGGKFVDAETEKWGKVAANIKL